MNSIDSAISSVLDAKQTAINAQVEFAIAARQLSAQKHVGQAMVDLIDAAVDTAKALDRGTQFNALA